MSYVLPLPDGTNIAIREGETDEQAWRRAQQTYPEAFGITPTDTRQREVPKQEAQPEGGFVPAVKAGFRNLAGDTALTLGKAGIIDPATAEKYRAEQEEAARGIFKPTEDDWATSPWQKLKETAGQSLPYMAAPLAAGAGAAALGAPALAAAGAAGLASTGVFTGSNLARQVDTGKTLDQTSGSDAFMAAIPQAALDMVSFRMIPGIGKIFGAAGEKITEASAKQLAEQTLKQTAKDYALKTGKAMTAEGLTEAAQQVLERLQAGLALDDPEARKEYFESFVGGAALAGPLGAGGRFVERGQIKAGGEQMKRDRLAGEAEAAAADATARQYPGPMPLQGPQPLQGPPAPPPQPRHPTEVAADVARLNGLYEQHQQALSDANEAGDFDRSQQISDAMGALDAQRAALAGELKESANSPGARRQEAVRVLEKTEALLRRQTGPGTDPAEVRKLLERRASLVKFLQENGDPRVEGQEQFGGREQDLRAAATQQGVPNTAPREELSPEELLAAQNRDAGGNPMAGYEASMGDVADAQEQVATQRKVADEAGALSRMGQKPVTPMFTDVFGADPPAPQTQLRLKPEHLASVPGETWAPLTALKHDASPAVGRTGLDLKLHKLASVRNEAWTALEKLRGEMNNLPAMTPTGERIGLQRRLSAAYLRHEALDKNFQTALKKQQETELQPIGGGPREGGPSEAAKRVPGAQLVLREKNENAGVDRASVQTRLDEALNREDLSPAARGLLERLSNVGLPASDNTGVLSMVDKQLSSIESGQEGVVAPGPNDIATTPRGDVRGEANTTNGLPAYKNQLGNAEMRSAAPGQAASTAPVGKAKEEARADTAGTAPVAQRAAVPVQETVARANAAGRYNQTGAEADARAKQAEDAAKNARAKPLHAAADLEAHVGMLESMAEPNVKQGSLFNDEPVTQRATPKTFQRFLDSKHVAALRKVIDDAKTAYTRAGTKAVELRKKASALLTQAVKMHIATGEHRAAERVLKSHGGLKALKAAADRLRSVATDVVVENMSLQGEIDTLQTEHAALSRDFINASSVAQEPMGVMGGAANAAMADNVKKLQYEIETQQDLLVAKQADAAALKLAMNALDKNLAVLQLRDNRAALREAAATPAELEQAGQDLRAAEKESTVAEEEFRKLKVDRDAQDAANRQKTRREQGAAEDAERAAAWKKRDEFMQTVREIMGQFDPEAKTHVRALHSLERAHREGAAPPAGLYFDKELKWLKTEIGKVEKQIADVEKEVRASRTKANTMGREGIALVGPRARLVAALSRKLNALEEAYDYKAATEGAYTQVGGVEPAKRTVVKGSIVDDKLEQAQAHGAARDRMRELQDTLREAKKKGRIPKAKLAALEEKVAAAEAEEKELREGLAIEGAVTQVARVDSAAPAKLRTGSPESRANPGTAKRPLVEARNTASPTAAAAIEEGNRVSEARNAEAEPLTAEQEQVVAEEQQAELLHTTERREETLRKQLADARASVAALRESIKYNKAVTPDTIQRKVDEAASIEQELKAVRKELDRLLGPAAPDTNMPFAGVEELRKVPESVAKALSEGDLTGALDALSADGGTELTRALAEKLRPLLTTTKVGAADLKGRGTDSTKSVAGEYSPSQNTIFLQEGRPVTEHVLLHEAAHAATVRVLRMPEHLLTNEQRNAKHELKAMLKQLTNDKAFADEYGIKNLEEFVAELSANKSFNDKLSLRTFNKGNWLTKAWDAVKRLLGLKTAPGSNMQSAADAAFDKILTPSGKTFGPSLNAEVYANDRLAKAVEDTKGLIATKRTFRQAVMDNLNGTSFDEEAFNRPDPAALPEDIEKLRKQHEKLDTSKLDVRGVAFRTQAIDALDPIQRIAAAMKDSLKASQMMFDLRSYGQRMNFTAQAVLRGGLTRKTITRADGRHEYVYEAGGSGGGLKPVVDILKDAPAGTGDATNQLFSRYLVAKRAANVGLDKMDLGGSVTQAHLDEVMAAIKATPGLEKVFERAAAAYHVHNASLLRFAEQTGAISKEEVDRLISQGDYVPYYRQRDGIVTLVLGTETPIRIGSLKEQPHLKQLVGGDQPILDFMTSAVQNTHLLTDMALRNQATKDVAINLAQMGLADINNKAKQTGTNVVHFYHEGKERTARIDTEAVGIPADVLVRGMEGIATTLPGILKVFGMGSHLLRRSITSSPLYMVRQLFRDSIASTFVSGTSLKTPLSALKQIGRNSDTKDVLDKRGVTGGQIFTGTTEDISNILGRLTSGKGHFMQLFHKLEQGAMEADAATRRAQFQSYRAQGLSEMESTMMSLESMNFSRRGSSPSVHAISQLIPFFNAQIQGLDVLWRAAHGTMPFNERLEIQKKLLTRGAMLAGMSMVYAMAMQDDEAYRNANPEEKYSNWFVRLPGVDQTVRLPVPFEIGYIFKSLPEAMVNMVMNDGTEDAKQAFGQILKQSIPGGTSMGVPQLVRPALENALNKSFFTSRDLISPAEARLQPAQQYRDNTSETAKAIGDVFGLSPIKIENLVRGYTGGMGMALIQALGMPFEGGEQGGKATKRLSDTPLFGTAFQPDDAGGIINRTYERVKEIQQAQATFNDMLKRGNRAQAAAFLQANAEDISKASFANSFPQMMADLAKAEAAVKASALSPAEKRERLDALRQRKIMLSKAVRGGLAGS